MTDYKTFNDLEFKAHEAIGFGLHARIDFSNGYGVSVVTGEYAFTDDAHPYELAVFKDGNICYDTPITNDVIGYLTEDDVTEIMKKVQDLSATKKDNDNGN